MVWAMGGRRALRAVAVGGAATLALIYGMTVRVSPTIKPTFGPIDFVFPSQAPAPHLSKPGNPRDPTASAAESRAMVTWGRPESDGGSAIITYLVTSSSGGFAAAVPGDVACSCATVTVSQMEPVTRSPSQQPIPSGWALLRLRRILSRQRQSQGRRLE